MNAYNEFWSEFLDLYKSQPVLWNVKNENYCNRVEREAAYELLVDKLQEIDPDASSEKVRRKIHIFRSNYNREMKKITKLKKSGVCDGDVLLQSTLWYFDQLHFLTDQDEHIQPKNNMSDDESVSDRTNVVFETPVKRKNVRTVEIVKKECENVKESKGSLLAKVWATQCADNVFWAEFLEMYKSLPILWKVRRENSLNRMEKRAAYNQLVNKLKEIDPEANTEIVRRKIHNFRSNYRRELRKIQKSRDGGDDDYQSSLWYFDLLRFLTDQEEQSKTNNNMSDDDSNSVSDRGNEVFDEEEITRMACEILKDSNDDVETKVDASEYEDNLFWFEFLQIYKSLPVLWKVTSENYYNREDREAAYEQLVDKLKEIDPEASKRKVKKEIQFFRSNYKRELKKMEKSGVESDDMYQSSLWYFDLLHFLTDQEEEHSKANSNMGDDDSNRVSDRGNEVFEEDEINVMSCENLKESSNATSALAEGWASQYAELGNEQRVLARIIWADVLFHGCMNRLTEKMVEDIHHVLKDTSNTSNTSPTSVPTPYNEEISHSPQPQFTFVAFEQSDKPQVSHTTKSKQSGVVRQISSTDLPSTSTSRILHSPTNEDVIETSSLTQANLIDCIVSSANDDDYVLNNSDEIEDIIEEAEYGDILYEIDDDDLMESIDHEDDSQEEINNQQPEENTTRNATEVAVSILKDIREGKLNLHSRRINWQKLSDEECRELRRLQRKRDCVCDQCGKHFTEIGNLKLHQMRHTGIKNYECKECKAKFYTAHLLKQHSLRHKNSPPQYACKYCGKTFIYNNYRLQHERSHLMERRFHCDYCDKSFYKAIVKKNHELKHLDRREFHCELCDQHFYRKTHLMAHYRSKAHKNREQENK